MKFGFVFIVFLLFNFGGLALGTVLMDNGPESVWYTSLQQAPWTPPGWVFGAAWTCVMIFFSVFMTFLYINIESKIVVFWFVLEFVLNVSWNYIFFNQHLTILGFINILILLGLTLYFLFGFKSILNNTRLFILPYCLWLLVATSLNFYIVIYN